MRGLRDMGYEYTIRCDTLIPIDVANVMLLLNAPDRQLWEGVDICPRTGPSDDATLVHMVGGLLGQQDCGSLVLW